MKHTDFKIRSARQFGAIHGNSPFHTAPLGVPLAALALGLLAPLLLLTVALVMQYEPTAVLAISPALAAKREELKKENKIIHDAFESCKNEDGELEYGKLKKIGDEDVSDLSIEAKSAKMTERLKRTEKMGKECDALAALDAGAKSTADLQKQFTQPGGLAHPAPEKKREPFFKTLGGLVFDGSKSEDRYNDHVEQSPGLTSFDFKGVYPSEIMAASQIQGAGTLAERVIGQKTLFETTAGWTPESIRTGLHVEAATRPIEILDIIPMNQTDFENVLYMLETTRTHSAAETAEGSAYPESTFVNQQQTSPVRKIADSIPVTDEQLADVAMVRSYLNNRLIFGLRQRLDTQVMSGDGAAPNLEGILNVSGIQTQAKGSDPEMDAFYKAMTNVIVTGRAVPSAIVMHRNDWQTIRLKRTADGIYILGNPADPGPERLWGLPVVQTTVSENTGLVGDFRNFCSLFEREGVTVQVGYVNTQFTEGEQTIRAQFRIAFVVTRAAAFCTVTGI